MARWNGGAVAAVRVQGERPQRDVAWLHTAVNQTDASCGRLLSVACQRRCRHARRGTCRRRIRATLEIDVVEIIGGVRMNSRSCFNAFRADSPCGAVKTTTLASRPLSSLCRAMTNPAAWAAADPRRRGADADELIADDQIAVWMKSSRSRWPCCNASACIRRASRSPDMPVLGAMRVPISWTCRWTCPSRRRALTSIRPTSSRHRLHYRPCPRAAPGLELAPAPAAPPSSAGSTCAATCNHVRPNRFRWEETPVRFVMYLGRA